MQVHTFNSSLSSRTIVRDLVPPVKYPAGINHINQQDFSLALEMTSGEAHNLSSRTIVRDPVQLDRYPISMYKQDFSLALEMTSGDAHNLSSRTIVRDLVTPVKYPAGINQQDFSLSLEMTKGLLDVLSKNISTRHCEVRSNPCVEKSHGYQSFNDYFVPRNGGFFIFGMRRAILLVLFLLVAVITNAQEPIKLAEPTFKAGEELSYRLKYGWFTGAEAHLRVADTDAKFEGRPAWHIIADGQTAGTFDVFYKVRNRYETYIDRSTLLPYLYTENRHEAKYRHTDRVEFDHQTHKITANSGVYPFSGKVFDFPSAYYFARCLDVSKLKIGDKFDLRYFLDDAIQTLSITYMGKEKAECAMGTFNCLKFNPTIIPGRIFKKNSKLYLWVTDDENRIPVKAHVELIVGSVKMDLTSAKGLKFPLNPIKK